jgi:hypothetical protein
LKTISVYFSLVFSVSPFLAIYLWSLACTCLRLSRENLGRFFRVRHSLSHDCQIGPLLLLVHSNPVVCTGSSVDFYIRNVLNTLVRFYLFLSLLVHALLNIFTLCVDCFLLTASVTHSPSGIHFASRLLTKIASDQQSSSHD